MPGTSASICHFLAVFDSETDAAKWEELVSNVIDQVVDW